MRSTSPYLDTSFSFDSPGSLADAGVLDSGKAQIMGRATGHYRAQTVHAGLQYFDCNLQFPEPLQIDKLLPQSLCVVHVFTVPGSTRSTARSTITPPATCTCWAWAKAWKRRTSCLLTAMRAWLACALPATTCMSWRGTMRNCYPCWP